MERDKQELMMRLYQFEEKTKKAEKGVLKGCGFHSEAHQSLTITTHPPGNMLLHEIVEITPQLLFYMGAL